MGKYMIVKREEYEEQQKLLYSATEKNREYLIKLVNVQHNIDSLREDISYMSNNISSLSALVNVTLDQLKKSETARRTNAGKIGGLTASLNKEKKENEELQSKVKDLEVKLEESMSDKYRVKKIPSGRPPKTQTMKIKNCSVESNIARKMFGDSK